MGLAFILARCSGVRYGIVKIEDWRQSSRPPKVWISGSINSSTFTDVRWWKNNNSPDAVRLAIVHSLSQGSDDDSVGGDNDYDNYNDDEWQWQWEFLIKLDIFYREPIHH